MVLATRAGTAARAVGAVLTIGALIAGCGSDAKVVEKPDGTVTVRGKGKRATVSVGGEHGATVTYNQQGLPAGFPTAVPQPAGLKLLTATSAPAGAPYFQLTYASANPARSLAAYRTQLEGAGFTASGSAAGQGRGVETLQASGQGWTLTALGTGTGTVGVVNVAVARSTA